MKEKCLKNKRTPSQANPWKQHKIALIMLIPALLTVFIFNYIPLAGLVIAFKDYDVFKGIIDSPWVGFENFRIIFDKPEMLKAIYNSLIYGLTITFVGFPFPIILALLFNELRNARFKKVVQTISYMPHFLSWASIVSLFYAFFASEGSFNMIMAKIIGEGYEPVNILMDSKYFLGIIFGSHLWKSVGWESVVYLAAITGIDSSLYEAASIDGCSKFKQAFYITLPMIRNTAVILLVMSLGGIVATNFEQVYGFQNVFIQEDTETINTLIYREGIQNGKYSLATAFGLSQGLVTLILVLSANFISKKLMKVSIW